MKRIVFVRHGKAERLSFDQDDFKRNLVERGMEDAEEMAERLKRKKINLEYWISSPANRAFQTAKIFANTFQIESGALSIEPAIYEASVKNILTVINQQNNKYQSLILFGHNPGFSDIIGYLSNEDGIELPTSAFAILEFDITDWQQISQGLGKLIDFDFPKSMG